MSRFGSFRSLLVADARERDALRRCILAAFPEADVDEADTADEALWLLRRRDYALVLADRFVGITPGAEVLDVAAREHPWTLRVLATPGSDAPEPAPSHATLPRDAPLEAAVAALLAITGRRPRPPSRG